MTEYDVVVVGGGATGAGLLRDLAMRGVRSLLVEQGDLATGTTGHFHGLLHSGARYAVRDPDAARECIEENRVVRRIAAPAVEDTGGLFCWLEGDPDDYPAQLLAGCRAAGIEIHEVPAEAARRDEPLLTPALRRAFAVPDATIEPWGLVGGNVEAALELGAGVRRYTRLAGVGVEAGAVRWVELEDVASGARERVGTAVLASAAGYWAGRVARLAGVELEMAPGWGTMVVMNQRLASRVVNRCRAPGDGDIVVPVGPVSILGTTDRTLDTDEYEVTRAEVAGIMAEAAAMMPAVAERRVLRVFAGARPLYDPGHDASDSRFLSRSHTVLDHARDGVEGFVSIVGGKLTTYRLMAQDTADAVCRKLGVTAPCRTAEEPLPEARSGRHYRLGDRLTAREDGAAGADADLVCECELVSRAMVEEHVAAHGRTPIDDLLRATRLGMGPCQGAYCALRAAGILERAEPAGGSSLAPLRGFLDERMKGDRPILWGDQARQLRLNEIVYREVLDLDHGP
ncbi:MAG: anaerobic glycerol-3-phosphate dehydrogenase subunit A [Chloroflexi bacterium]|nr:MAG: anaerobic glycerol-3-phosphate dehydrogenase subunit A [Chloroflexota bacterium]